MVTLSWIFFALTLLLVPTGSPGQETSPPSGSEQGPEKSPPQPLADRSADPVAPSGHVRMTVQEVLSVRRGGRRDHIIYLGSADANAHLPIVVSRTQAFSIATALEGKPYMRPLTHDLFHTFMLATGTGLREVRIDLLRKLDEGQDGSTYFATLVVTRPGEADVELDARPSDALALALRTGAPIFVSLKLLEENKLREPDDKKGKSAPRDESEESERRPMLLDRSPGR